MRSAIAGPVTPLLGSLGLHGGAVLALVIAVRHPAHVPVLERQRPDAWLGNAVEVDALATPDQAASLPSRDSAVARLDATTTHEAAVADAIAPDSPRARVPRVATPRPRGATAGAADPSGGTGGGAPASGAFGALGLPPGVRSLPSAFTRAIPPASAADPIWQTLPVGSQRPFTIAIEVDADGHISRAVVVEEKDGGAPAAQALHVRQRVVALLGGGLFALKNDVSAGRVLLRVSITLSDRPVRDEDAPAEQVEHGFEPPHGQMPGRAYFTLASGRHFEAKVQVLTPR